MIVVTRELFHSVGTVFVGLLHLISASSTANWTIIPTNESRYYEVMNLMGLRHEVTSTDSIKQFSYVV